MKHYLFLLCCVCLFAPAAFAVTPPTGARALRMGGKVINPASWSGKRVISAQLKRRARYAAARAYIAQRSNTPNLITDDFGATVYFTQPLDVPIAALYPQNTFLTTHQQLTDYFGARNNRIVTQIFPKVEQLQKLLVSRLDDFRADKQVITHSPQEDLPWLAAQIPSDTQYLLLGECHEDFPKKTIEQTLRLVRARFPQRDIFLFSEFLLPGQTVTDVPVTSPYAGVFQTAAELGLYPRSLEPWYVQKRPIPHMYYTHQQENLIGHKKVWSSMEGVRLRNTYWVELLRRYRAKYPHALFILYAGGLHLEYNAFYSVGAALPQDKTFLISFYPAKKDASRFEKLTDFPFSDERVLQFKDPQLRQLAGFDIRLQVPPRK